MSAQTQLPKLNRIDFYRLHGDDLLMAFAAAVMNLLGENPDARLTPQQLGAAVFARMLVEVPDGGFDQFFYNHRGELGVAEVADLLEAIDVPKAGPLVRKAHDLYQAHLEEFAVDCDKPPIGTIEGFDAISHAFVDLLPRATRDVEAWARKHIRDLAVGDDGEPIKPLFTGTVEIPQPNGLAGESIEVKKGKPNGAYRQFGDDGGVRTVEFYKGGKKMTGDFWPNGQLMRKESKNKGQNVIEWFYPNGKVQKRYVTDKKGYVSEPVRLFHENGQLAEEVNVVGIHKKGPWLKFFDDGSPRLVAEYGEDKEVTIHDAWNDERVQVMKKGTGKFRHDGRDILWEYDIFGPNLREEEMEFKEGRRHGLQRISLMGRVSFENRFDRGELVENTTYWDSGRLKSISKYAKGKLVESQQFPKFDRPVPAVVLTLEANEELYNDWEHPPVETYPEPLNRKEVERQFELPAFLKEVDEQNRNKKLESSKDDWSTFKDHATFFVEVNEAGEVTDVEFEGGGKRSVKLRDTFPPLLQQLRFQPAIAKGRPVPGRVLATVNHTFVEGGDG
jgi:antitoxin component YwqK of YwqJK toxin-antitoxin module